MKRLLATDEQSIILFAQRVALGVVMLPHGAQKVFGWFGGPGFTAEMAYFTNVAHVPAPLAFLVIVGESLGALGLVLGLCSRVSAFGIAAIMTGAVFIEHLGHGFFMNWFGNQKGEGFEYHLLALALAVPILIWGGGKYALDSELLRLPALESGASGASGARTRGA
jgi:putative oxidoreductase